MSRTCDICGDVVPYKLYIGDKVVLLGSRKRCLECTPYKSRADRQATPPIPEGGRVCERCGKDLTNKKYATKDLRICVDCYCTARRREIKRRAVDLKGGKCERCGYNKSMAALVFHHKDGSDKTFNVAGSARAWYKIVNEIRKCELLCANCHAELHDENFLDTHKL